MDEGQTVRYTPGVRILLLCTANICRSPMAGALLVTRTAGLPDAPEVGTAGLLPGGRPVPTEVLETMAEYGIDLSAHRSTTLESGHLAAADLVLGMGRRHVQEAAVLLPSCWDRTFRLKEFVRRAAAVGPRTPGRTAASWITEVHGDRTRSALATRAPDDDVADPFGGPRSGYEATAAELAGLVAHLTALAFPVPTGG